MFLEDQRNSRAVLLCDCGCGRGFNFQYIDGAMFIDFLISLDDGCSRNKRLWKCFWGNKLLLDMTVPGHDLEDLVAFLEKYPVEDTSCVDDQDLKITCEPLSENVYDISVYSTQSKWALIKRHGYVGEFIPGPETVENMIRQFRTILREHPPVAGITINGWK